MKRVVFVAVVAISLLLPACSSPPAEPPEPPPPPTPPLVIPPPPPPLVDVLPEFKKSAAAFLDFAKKQDAAAATNPPPSYNAYWKDCVPLLELYTKVINNEPKSGPGAEAFDRVNKIRDSLFKTQLILKNTEDLKTKQLVQLLETEAGKRTPLFEEAEFFWKQTPDAAKTDEELVPKTPAS